MKRVNNLEKLIGQTLKVIENEIQNDSNRQAAQQTFAIYDAFVKAGFDEDQAFELLLNLMPKQGGNE
jgi:hypothetical protein